MITVQKLQKDSKGAFDIAQKYFRILSGLNNLELTKSEINLISFIATRGIEYKKEFCGIFNVSVYSINNTVRKLKKKGLLIKENKKVVLPKPLRLDFSNPITLQIKLNVTEAD